MQIKTNWGGKGNVGRITNVKKSRKRGPLIKAQSTTCITDGMTIQARLILDLKYSHTLKSIFLFFPTSGWHSENRLMLKCTYTIRAGLSSIFSTLKEAVF